MSSPRLNGINEQLDRAKSLVEEAQDSGDALFRFRHLVAAIYPARAIVELMLESADKEETTKSRGELEQLLVAKLPRYRLLEKMRIHDFHRFGIQRHNGVFVGGPIKLKAKGKGGVAALYLGAKGLIKKTSKGSTVSEQRPLQMRDDQVFDEEENRWVTIETVLIEYLAAVPTALEMFAKVARSRTA